MRSKSTHFNLKTLLWRLTSRVRVVGGLMFMSLILLNTAVFLRSSHSAICAVFENKANNISGPLGRELLLGDSKIVREIFDDFKKSFVNLHAAESLELVISKSEPLDVKCEPHVFSARVSYPVKFGTDEFGLIKGQISYLSFTTIVLMLTLGALIVFIGVRLLTARLSKELEAAVVKPMRQLSQGDLLENTDEIPSEILEIEMNLQNLKSDIRAKERIAQDLVLSKELGDQAERLSHDIISPLNALNSIVDALDGLDSVNKKTLRLAVSRIEDITRNLHKRSKNSRTEKCNVKVSDLIGDLFSEKKIEYRNRPLVQFNLDSTVTPSNVVPVEHSVELKRILSNLVNNAVESISDTGSITVRCSAQAGDLYIGVEDTGRGIPSNIIPELMKKGKTYKKGGSGLGLFYAKQIVESWGGRIEISSKLGAGTSVRFNIPLFISDLKSSSGEVTCVLIDNDELTRLVWEDAAQKDGVTIKTYSHPEDFFHDEATLDRKVVVYIDSDLGLEHRGEHIAKEIKELGFEKIYLATGFPKENFQDYPWLSAILSKTPAWRTKGAQNAAS